MLIRATFRTERSTAHAQLQFGFAAPHSRETKSMWTFFFFVFFFFTTSLPRPVIFQPFETNRSARSLETIIVRVAGGKDKKIRKSARGSFPRAVRAFQAPETGARTTSERFLRTSALPSPSVDYFLDVDFFFRFILFFSSEWSDCNRSLSFGTRPNLLTILETLVGSLETAVCCETEWESLSGLLQSRAEPSGALEGHCRLGDDQNSLAEKTSLRFTKQTGDRWMKN